MGVIRCAGDNNAKELPKSKKGSWEWTYTSVGRHLVRMWWLTGFMSHLFNTLVHKQEVELAKATRDAYDSAFAPHHPWIVRKGAGLATRAVPNKDVLAKSINVKTL